MISRTANARDVVAMDRQRNSVDAEISRRRRPRRDGGILAWIRDTHLVYVVRGTDDDDTCEMTIVPFDGAADDASARRFASRLPSVR